MPTERLTMRRVREVLRLKHGMGLSVRQIARSCSMSNGGVVGYLQRARAAHLSWPLPGELDDATLEALLFPSSTNTQAQNASLPDFPRIHQELRSHRHLTLSLLWQEYKENHREAGYQYSRFCQLYRAWEKKLDAVMRQEHRAGDKTYVDHAGPTVPVIDPHSGELREASIFVAVLGASSYTYAEATWTRDLYDWIGSHVRMFEFFQGVSEAIVPDNWRTAVTKPCWYEPDLNPTYRDLAEHYNTVILPARVRKARDKAKAEAGVLLVERWILAALRHQTFVGLAALNQAVCELLVRLNHRKFRKLDTSRADLYERVDRPALKPLPAEPFIFGEWKKARVNIDYHIEIERHYYSAPFDLRHKQIEARIRAATVEIFHNNKRVAIHARSSVVGGYSTLAEHRPPNHKHYLEWTPERFISWAGKIGPSAAGVVGQILQSRRYPEQGYRACLGLMRLARSYPAERVEAACTRALAVNACSYRSVKSMLETGLDRQPIEEAKTPEAHRIMHDNVRGAAYYAEEVRHDA
jgi:transposase